MPVNLKQIIKDKDTYSDNLVITLAGGEQTTLAELRALDADERKQLLKEQADFKKDQDQLKADIEVLKSAQANVAGMYSKLVDSGVVDAGGNVLVNRKGAEPMNDDPFAALSAYESDAVLGPIAKALKRLDTQLGEINEKGKVLNSNQHEMAKAYVQDRLEDMYGSIANRKADVTIEQLVKVASDQGFRTRTGLPDIRKAYSHVTSADTEAARVADIEKQARAKVLKELGVTEDIVQAQGGKAIRVASPSTGGIGGTGINVPNQSSYKTLDEAMSAASKDEAIWAAVPSGLPQ